MNNAICIDLEPWYSAELVRKYMKNDQEINDLIIESVTPILDLLDKHQTKATFAVVGTVAEKYPGLISNIFKNGHEIASHAYSHKTLYELGENGFELEIDKSVKLLTSITGTAPVTFRAPSFSINQSTKWAFPILSKYGFKYDASIFPIKTSLYGIPKAPMIIYKPSVEDICITNPEGPIIEFPNTVIKLGMNLPVTGGFYFRAIPLPIQRAVIRRINRMRPVLFYLHPWEIYAQTPRIKDLPLFSKWITYYGINRSLKKFENLLKSLQFAPINQVIQENATKNG